MSPNTRPYRLLPFNFGRRNNRVLLSNDVGDFIFLDDHQFGDFIGYCTGRGRPEYEDLKSRGFLRSSGTPPGPLVEWMATRYRTKKRFLEDFTSLHMFVVTYRCNQKCLYCHASSVPPSAGESYDMTPDTARKLVDLAFRSPSEYLKIEFQGGEPLLNFGAVKAIIERAEEVNLRYGKKVEYVVCTNLVGIDEENLCYLHEKGCLISTSLDGPADIHDACRRQAGGLGSHAQVIAGIAAARRMLGADQVSALATITNSSVRRMKDVVDEYVRQGFSSIFLRMLNPFGRAVSQREKVGYGVEEFLDDYRLTLDYIINLNRKGVYVREEYATLLLTKILTPFSTGFVDLQSPAGIGISGVIYDTNGDVYVSDEARMLARTGDRTFRLGNVEEDDWRDMFCGEKLRTWVEQSVIESLPGCAWCVYQPYCGGDPVRNYALTGDVVPHPPSSPFCRKNKGIFDILFDHMSSPDSEVLDVFWSWITSRSLEEVRVP